MAPCHPIRQARQQRHLQVSDLALLCGVTTVTVWRWERGLVEPTRAHLQALTRILGTHAVDLVPALAALLQR
jgi:transcriptional regulator with XRE-family HTH domain